MKRHAWDGDGNGFSSLLANARQGDADAVAKLYEKYSSRVLAAIRPRLSPLLRSKYDTLDFAHSVFAEVIRELPRLEDRGERAFVRLLQIKAQNKVRRKLKYHMGRDGQRAEMRLSTDAGRSAAGPDVADGLASIDDAAKLKTVLASLDETAREILRRRLDGKSFAEIASALGLPSEEAVRMRHARAVAAMRRRWDAAAR